VAGAVAAALEVADPGCCAARPASTKLRTAVGSEPVVTTCWEAVGTRSVVAVGVPAVLGTAWPPLAVGVGFVELPLCPTTMAATAATITTAAAAPAMVGVANRRERDTCIGTTVRRRPEPAGAVASSASIRSTCSRTWSGIGASASPPRALGTAATCCSRALHSAHPARWART
jgi:hypothetical protein